MRDNPNPTSGNLDAQCLISIVVPVLNEEKSIARTINSLAGFPHTELIIVDGGSTDGTVAVALNLKLSKIIECSRANRGAQMNAGARAAAGDLLLFLHADVVLPASGLDAIRNAVRDARVTGGCFQIRFPQNVPAGLRLVAWGINLRTRLLHTATGDQAIFIRRHLFETLGGYQELPLMEDIELFNEMKKAGAITVLDARIEISPRRWIAHGILRTVLLMYVLRLGYWLGVKPATLKKFFVDVR